MIEVRITDGNEIFILSPHTIDIPDFRGMNEILQHEEQTCNLSAVYDSALVSFLVSASSITAEVYDGNELLFTGTVDDSFDFSDNGEPEPADVIKLTIRDKSSFFDRECESEFACIGENLSEIIESICLACDVTSEAVFEDDPVIDAFVLDRGKRYIEPMTELLFQYGYTWYFNQNGNFEVLKINLSQTPGSLTDSDFLAGLRISKTSKKYDSVKVTYGTLTKKANEQVYFEGNGLDDDKKVIPITIRSGQYYPYDSDPVQEAREGKVYQEFASGYAESYKTYSGEQKYRRSEKSTLIYTENHTITQDWSGSITIDRTEFGARSAAVRLRNTGNEDAALMQFAIRADAYYLNSENTVKAGSGKKVYSYESQYIYSSQAADDLAQLLYKLYASKNLRIQGLTERPVIPGKIYEIDTGTSGLTSTAIALKCSLNPESGKYAVTLLSVSDIAVNPARYKLRHAQKNNSDSIPDAKIVNITAPQGLVFKNNAPAQLPLEVKSTGFTPTSYKWYKDGVEISGATGSTYNVGSASPGVYKVVVDNKYEDYVTVISVIDGEWDSVYQCVIEKGVAPEMEVEDGDSLVLDDEQGVLQTESEENRKNSYRITVYKDGEKASETLYGKWRYEKFKEYIGSTPTYEWTNFENITITNGEAYVRTDHETIRQIQCSVYKNSNYDTMVCTGITNNEKAASYHLETSSNTIKSTFEGTYSPSELTVNGKQKVSSNPGDFEGYFKIFYSLVPNPASNDWQPAYSSESQEASHTWSIAPNGIQLIKCQLYADEDFENLLEEDIIPITKDGKDSKGYNVSVSNENFAIPTDAENLKPLENTSVTVEFTAIKGADELNATKENTILQSQFKLTFPQSQGGISIDQDNSHPEKLAFTATTTTAISRSQNIEITFTFSDGTQLKKNVTITATTQGPKGNNGGYMDYKYLKADFGLSNEELLASTDWQETQPAPEEGKCIYMASKWID